MIESESAYLNRIEKARSATAPRLEAAGAAAADQAAKYKVAMERLQTAGRAGIPASDEELQGVRLAVERARLEIGKRDA